MLMSTGADQLEPILPTCPSEVGAGAGREGDAAVIWHPFAASDGK